jgi:hypothetical protein
MESMVWVVARLACGSELRRVGATAANDRASRNLEGDCGVAGAIARPVLLNCGFAAIGNGNRPAQVGVAVAAAYRDTAFTDTGAVLFASGEPVPRNDALSPRRRALPVDATFSRRALVAGVSTRATAGAAVLPVTRGVAARCRTAAVSGAPAATSAPAVPGARSGSASRHSAAAGAGASRTATCHAAARGTSDSRAATAGVAARAGAAPAVASGSAATTAQASSRRVSRACIGAARGVRSTGGHATRVPAAVARAGVTRSATLSALGLTACGSTAGERYVARTVRVAGAALRSRSARGVVVGGLVAGAGSDRADGQGEAGGDLPELVKQHRVLSKNVGFHAGAFRARRACRSADFNVSEVVV